MRVCYMWPEFKPVILHVQYQKWHNMNESDVCAWSQISVRDGGDAVNQERGPQIVSHCFHLSQVLLRLAVVSRRPRQVQEANSGLRAVLQQHAVNCRQEAIWQDVIWQSSWRLLVGDNVVLHNGVPWHDLYGRPDPQLPQQLSERLFIHHPALIGGVRLHVQEDPHSRVAPFGGHVEHAGHLQQEEAAHVLIIVAAWLEEVERPHVYSPLWAVHFAVFALPLQLKEVAGQAHILVHFNGIRNDPDVLLRWQPPWALDVSDRRKMGL